MRHAVWVGAVAVLVTGVTAFAQEKKPDGKKPDDKKPDVLLKIEGHRGGVAAIAFNPEIPLLATGSGNGVIRVWELKAGKLAGRLDPQKHNGARVNHLGFSADGSLISASSKNAVVVWDISPPPPPIPPKKAPFDPKLDPFDPKIDPKGTLPEAKAVPADPVGRPLPVVYEDTLGTDAVKIGVVTGSGKRAYYTSTEGARITVSSHAFSGKVGADTSDEFKAGFTPLAVAAINDHDSDLVAMYGTAKGVDKSEPAVAFVGLGDAKIIARGMVRAPVAGRPLSINFAPDGKWLIVCNGEDLMYWRVPGSQVVTGDPKLLANSPAFAAAVGPNGRIAFASPPEDGKKVKVTITDVSGTSPKIIAEYATDIEKVSALAFSPDGGLLAVGDDTEGVVQVWSLK